jgi:ATP-dependent protease HslVU (ClpYQ) peptidase subunit
MQEVLWLPNLSESDFEKLGLEFSPVVAEYDLDEIKDRVQIRSEKHVAPAARVKEYAQRMKAEQTPPILVTEDGYVVDGNTRIKGARKNGRKHLPAVVVKAHWKGADDSTRARLEALAAKANRHGEPLDKKEKRLAVRELVKENWTNEMISMFVGVVPAMITEIKDEIAAENKFARVGIATNGSIVKDTSLRALGKAADLNDEPFTLLARLTTDAGLNAIEVRSLAKGVREAGSDAAAISLLDEERKARKAQIDEKRLTGHGRPPVSRQLRQHLGFVNKYGQDGEALVERNPEYQEAHLQAMKTAINVLSVAIVKQEALR